MVPQQIINILSSGQFATARQIAALANTSLNVVHQALETIRQARGQLGYLASKPGPRGGYALVAGTSPAYQATEVWVENWRSANGITPAQSPLL